MLTQVEFDKLFAGQVITKGEIENSPLGIYMTDTRRGEMLKWIAVKGYGNDWAIYCRWATNSYEFIETSRDKVRNKENILKLVPCEASVLSLYRF